MFEQRTKIKEIYVDIASFSIKPLVPGLCPGVTSQAKEDTIMLSDDGAKLATYWSPNNLSANTFSNIMDKSVKKTVFATQHYLVFTKEM